MLRALVLIASALTAAMMLFAQHPPVPSVCHPPQVPDISGQGCHLPTPEEVRQQKERDKALTHQRYVAMQRDTDKLFELAGQLKKEVDAAGEQRLSLAAVKKADEIEKLAKSVKQKMKGD